MKIGIDIAGHGRQLRVGSEDRFRRLALLHHFLGLFLVLPEIRLRDFLFQGGYGFTAAGNVKDNSARVRCACEARPVAAVNLQSSWSVSLNLEVLRANLSRTVINTNMSAMRTHSHASQSPSAHTASGPRETRTGRPV